MLAYINSNIEEKLHVVDFGKAFVNGKVEEYEYLSYMDKLSQAYIKIKLDELEKQG